MPARWVPAGGEFDDHLSDIVEDNISDVTDNIDPYRWIDKSTDTVDEGNTALGQPSPVRPGVEPPRSQFDFVVALAAAGPGGTPPAATPDLTVPILGALAPCEP